MPRCSTRRRGRLAGAHKIALARTKRAQCAPPRRAGARSTGRWPRGCKAGTTGRGSGAVITLVSERCMIGTATGGGGSYDGTRGEQRSAGTAGRGVVHSCTEALRSTQQDNIVLSKMTPWKILCVHLMTVPTIYSSHHVSCIAASMPKLFCVQPGSMANNGHSPTTVTSQ